MNNPRNCCVPALDEVMAMAMAAIEDTVEASVYRLIFVMFLIIRFHTAVWIT